MTTCLIPVSIAVAVGIGLVLMLWGRNRLFRSVGVLSSSVLGTVIAWIAGGSLFLAIGQRLWRYAPIEGDIILIGQDITLNQLLWIPLQDKCFDLVVILFFLVMLFGRGRRVGIQQSYGGYTVDDLLFDWSLDRFLDNHRPGTKLGGLAYQVVIVLSVLLALPATGLIAYGILQIVLSAGMTASIQGWIFSSIFGSCILFTLLFLCINGVVALQE